MSRRVRSRDGGPERRVVGHPKPGRKLGNRDGRDRDARQHVADLLDVGDEPTDRNRDCTSHVRKRRQRSQEQTACDEDGKDGKRQRVRDRRHRRNDVKVGGHHRQRSDLRRARDGKRLAQHEGQKGDTPRDSRSQQDDRRGAGKRQLKTDVPRQLGPPAEHRRGCQPQRGPHVRGAAEVGGRDRKATHRRCAHGRRGRAADHRVERDQAKRRPGRLASQDRRERALDDAREHGDLEPAEHEQVDQPGCDERFLQVGRNSLPDSQHDAEQHGRVRARQRRGDR